MESWLPYFVIVTALAVILQMAILLAMYLQFRRTAEHMTRVATDLQSRLTPILSRLQLFLDDTQPRITTLVTDAAEIVHLARGQAQKVDRIFTEATDRLRAQLIHVDQILSGTLETIEDTGGRIRRTVSGPVMQVSALIKGIQAGLEFFRARRRPAETSSGGDPSDEGLFI
jgi:hypothetical protein